MSKNSGELPGEELRLLPFSLLNCKFWKSHDRFYIHESLSKRVIIDLWSCDLPGNIETNPSATAITAETTAQWHQDLCRIFESEYPGLELGYALFSKLKLF